MRRPEIYFKVNIFCIHLDSILGIIDQLATVCAFIMIILLQATHHPPPTDLQPALGILNHFLNCTTC